MSALESTALFIFGALWGSFFYTLALRFADGSFRENALKALVKPSHCPHCGSRISPLGLVPVLGYALLRGKCPHCRGKISPAYPAVEILHGVLLVLLAWSQGFSIYTLAVFLIFGTAISISIIDIRTLVIPGSLVIALAILSVYPVYISGDPKDHLIAAAGMPVIFTLVILIFPGSFGGGDIKFASAIGFLMGVEFSIVVLECALIAGSIAGTVYALTSGKGLRIRIPFAPFLTLGLIVASLYGREILLLYYRTIY